MMRKGLFLTRHQGEISNVVDVDGLAEDYAGLNAVRVYDQFFGKTEQIDMLRQVKENQLEAVVLAGHSANLFETEHIGKAFVNALKRQGINQNRIVFTNLYEQVALVHADQPESATRKARLLIDTALAKATYCHKVETVAVRPKRSVLVIGITIEGLMAAGELLSKNFSVHLVEKQASWRLSTGEEEALAPVLDQLQNNPNATIFFETDLSDFAGWLGDYAVVLKNAREKTEVRVGGILLCLGQDREWIEQLKPKMRLDTDRQGLLVDRAGERTGGETKEPGIWFLNPVVSMDQWENESAEAHRTIRSMMASLERSKIEHPVLVSEVDATRCGGCGTCVKTCAFSASTIDLEKKISVIDATRCRGCGNCVTACPTSARDLVTFPTLYVNKAIDILSQGTSTDGEPKVLAFLCKNSGYMAADAAGKSKNRPADGSYSPNVLPLRIECGGNVDTVYLLKALKQGFDGIALVVCKDNHCHNVVGNTDMERRIGLLRAVLRSRGLDDNRLRIIHTFGHEGKRLNEELKAFSEDLKQMNRQ